MDDNENKMFSDEYSTESTDNNAEEIISEIDDIEGTIFSIDTENYTITKPKRVIIKAIIKND